MDVDGAEGGGGAADVNLQANRLVRIALFMEHRRMPLKRDDISKKVFGPSATRASRSFNRVFERAQNILSRTFGFELVELQSRAAMDKATAAADPSVVNDEDEDDDDAPAATQGKGKGKKKATGKKKAAPTGSKTYIIRSILHPTIISLASLPDEEVLDAELNDIPEDDDDAPQNARSQSTSSSVSPSCAGTLLSFSSPALPALENPAALGILHVILSLILVSGRLMNDREFRAALRQLHLPAAAEVPLGRSAHNLPGSGGSNSMNIDAYLQHLIRQGYLDRIVVGEGGKPKTSGKRGRTSTAGGDADDGEASKYEWRWGARSQSEIGEKAMAEFMAEFMVGSKGNDDQGEGRRAGGSGRGAQNTGAVMKKMMDGIEKAAGGNLADLK
ncbi:hypothetical protein BT96DRAFT_822681 [Gymnopus androsaceus JB14]|uniref:MAGE domain-containing protein n=1 Tax=Gymnopus androsaceus JB14 TaxID=1447944 RepID=A0A6A4HIJ9_9AGAR|nr:hypothetical protein BT96DRAFT_822681 [Gymnopus androsaceus JB14]